MNTVRVLIITDTPSKADYYARVIATDGYAILVVDSDHQAREVLERQPIDAIVLDHNATQDGEEDPWSGVFSYSAKARIVVIAENASISASVEAMRKGAYDFLSKPTSSDRLRAALKKALAREPVAKAETFIGKEVFRGFVGSSPVMRDVYRIITAAAASSVPVFLTGESGTGKEVAAQALHQLSPRSKKPFVAINCSAIPRDLVESELFGHTKGAFTGAIAERFGAVKLADGGTLFLDEICEMPLDMQAKLLRFLQSKTFQAVGASRAEVVDTRIICATNRQPLAELRSGRFREDLFYRLHVIPISLPPLRDRDNDVVEIAEVLLTKYAVEESRAPMTLTRDAKQRLLDHWWPGNVRELQNVIWHAVVMNDTPEITETMLRLDPQGQVSAGVERLKSLGSAMRNIVDPNANSKQLEYATSNVHVDPFAIWSSKDNIMPLRAVENAAIERALALCEGNMVMAASLLSINPSTLYRRRQKDSRLG